jgi:hypothetical protein
VSILSRGQQDGASKQDEFGRSSCGASIDRCHSACKFERRLTIRTAAAEVGHHPRRETVARNVTTMTRTYRAYAATLLGDYLDIRGQQTRRPDLYASDRYGASQKFGEEIRASGGAGLLYDSLRRRTGVNVVTHRPRNITDIVQTDHFEITVLARSRTIDVHRLSL